jgi:Ala-tRNA(Pro) deacylase
MGIAITVENYLNTKQVDFDLLCHDYSEGSFSTVRAAHIDSLTLAKGVVFRDEDMHYTMCVLPAQNKVRRLTLNGIFDRHLMLADEDELDDLFNDCQHGAIPALGQAYGMSVIWDDELLEAKDIYLEAGDHKHLIHIGNSEFSKLMNNKMHEHFSRTRPALESHPNC